MLALAVDWFACSLVTIVLVGGDRFFADAATAPDTLPAFITLGVYVVENAVLTATVGGSFGKLATRLRVVRVDGRGQSISLLMALARSLLIAAVIPPLVFRADGRGLHDLLAGSATVTLQTAKSLARR